MMQVAAVEEEENITIVMKIMNYIIDNIYEN